MKSIKKKQSRPTTNRNNFLWSIFFHRSTSRNVTADYLAFVIVGFSVFLNSVAAFTFISHIRLENHLQFYLQTCDKIFYKVRYYVPEQVCVITQPIFLYENKQSQDTDVGFTQFKCLQFNRHLFKILKLNIINLCVKLQSILLSLLKFLDIPRKVHRAMCYSSQVFVIHQLKVRSIESRNKMGVYEMQIT